MTGPTHQRFVFDTVFDEDGGAVSAAPRLPRLIPAGEVEVIRQAALRQGEQSAVAQAEQAMATALARIAAQIGEVMPILAAVAQEHRAGAAELALAAARKIAGEALDRFPEAPVVAALQALAGEVEAAPRLVVHAAPELAERLQKALEHAAGDAGYAGQITVKAAAGMTAAAFTFDWGDGRAAFDPEAAAARVAEALHTALAAEGVHGEPLPTPERPDSERPPHG